MFAHKFDKRAESAFVAVRRAGVDKIFIDKLLLYLPYEKYEKVVFIGKVLVKSGAPYHGAAAQLFHGDVLEMLFFE